MSYEDYFGAKVAFIRAHAFLAAQRFQYYSGRDPLSIDFEIINKDDSDTRKVFGNFTQDDLTFIQYGRLVTGGPLEKQATDRMHQLENNIFRFISHDYLESSNCRNVYSCEDILETIRKFGNSLLIKKVSVARFQADIEKIGVSVGSVPLHPEPIRSSGVSPSLNGLIDLLPKIDDGLMIAPDVIKRLDRYILDSLP